MQQRVAVWGTGNMGRTAIRSAVAFPGLHLSGVITSSRRSRVCAPDWPQPDQGVGDHRVIVDGDPQLSIVVRAADVPGGTRADGGNTTAANRLLGAIGWLARRSRASTTAWMCRCRRRCRPRWKRSAGPTDVAETRVAFTEICTTVVTRH